MIVCTHLKDADLILSENIYFDSSNKEEYILEFEKAKANGVVAKETNFEDDDWIIVSDNIQYIVKVGLEELWFKRFQNKYIKNIKFHDIDLAFRKYTLERVLSSSVRTFQEFHNLFMRIAELTNFFEEGKVSDFIKTARNPYRIQDVFDFFDFFGEFTIPEEYEEALEYLKEKNDTDKIRKLPSFMSIFDFQDIVDDFKATANESKLQKYYPILIWWYVTNRIPMRPTELLLLDYKCTSEKDGKFFLHVKRNCRKGTTGGSKIKNFDMQDVYTIQPIEITKECYMLIDSYKRLVNDACSSNSKKYLFSKELYINTRKRDNGQRKVNYTVFTHQDFRGLLNEFFIEIVQNEYGRCIVERKDNANVWGNSGREYIERLIPYDTRHLAIINLILMGNEYQTVMKLAYHQKIKTTKGYYSHIDEYARGYSLSYAKKILSEKNRDFERVSDYEEISRFNIYSNHDVANILLEWEATESPGEVTDSYRNVDGGRCIYRKNDMKICMELEGNHALCPYFIPDNDKDIVNKINECNRDIESVVKTLQYLVNNYDKIANFSEKYSVEIEGLRRKINNRAKIASKLESVDDISKALIGRA